MPIEVSQKLLSERYGGDETKKDIHEKNNDYLYMCRNAALFTAKKQGWDIVECGKDGKPRSIEDIFSDIIELIE